jgi:hypothetical protein
MLKATSASAALLEEKSAKWDLGKDGIVWFQLRDIINKDWVRWEFTQC